MRVLVLFIMTFLLSFPSFGGNTDVDIKSSEWKKLDLPNRFPQTFFVSNELSPMYFETGENFSDLSDFLISVRKGILDVDIDEDDKVKINEMMLFILKSVKNESIDEKRNYLINVSVNKVFDCEPCTEQKDYIEILNLNNINVINIYLI
jgi:hypothetical protein